MSYQTIWEGEIGDFAYRINADYGMPSFIVEYRDKELDRYSGRWYIVLHHEAFNFILTFFYFRDPHFKEKFALFSGIEAWYDDWM